MNANLQFMECMESTGMEAECAHHEIHTALLGYALITHSSVCDSEELRFRGGIPWFSDLTKVSQR